MPKGFPNAKGEHITRMPLEQTNLSGEKEPVDLFTRIGLVLVPLALVGLSWWLLYHGLRFVFGRGQ